jgi:hypothetical protein
MEWNIELGFKELHMITNIYSLQDCEKCDITCPCSVTACKFPFSIQVPEHLGTAGQE